MRTLAFTADIDRDVNVQVPGRIAAGSLDRGSGDAPRFSSSERGLGILLDVLDDIGLRATLFFEGRTAETIDCRRAAGHCIGFHGYDHEDLTLLHGSALEDAISSGFLAVSDSVGRPTCFRAPYMSADRAVLDAVLDATGVRDDSSFYTKVGGAGSNYSIGGMTEHPVNKARDSRGKIIAAYLWPMHEGKRTPRDYIDMAAGMDGQLVLADHSWHMAESRDAGTTGYGYEGDQAEALKEVLAGILDLGYRPVVIGRRSRCRPVTSETRAPHAHNIISGPAMDGLKGGAMTARLIMGKEVSEEIYSELRGRIAALVDRGVTPGLAVILVGDDPASKVYVRKKGEMCESLGMRSVQVLMPESTTQAELLAEIARLNADPSVHGLLVQLPLPAHIDERAVIDAVSPAKDVDCFHPYNVGRLLTGNPVFRPATPAGVQQMLVRSGIPTRGRHVVVVGRSNIVGKPMAALMVQKGDGADSTVTVVHSRSEGLADITRQADILISAVGRPGFITADMVKDGAVVIDVGTSRVPDPSKKSGTRLAGDVDFDAVKEKASAITPVPGGVGPMTICMLMANTVLAAEAASEVSL